MDRISKQPGNKIQINNRWRFNHCLKPAGHKQKPFLCTRAEGQAGLRPYCRPPAVGGWAAMIKRKFFRVIYFDCRIILASVFEINLNLKVPFPFPLMLVS